MMPSWVVEGVLAVSTRPGYRPGYEGRVPRHEVDAWTSDAQAAGIASIICLIGDDQLPLYARALPAGLIAHYRESGFDVAHIPAFDGMTHPFSAEQYDEAWRAFQRLPKPILVHCSAGMDRTGRIVQRILEGLRAES